MENDYLINVVGYFVVLYIPNSKTMKKKKNNNSEIKNTNFILKNYWDKQLYTVWNRSYKYLLFYSCFKCQLNYYYYYYFLLSA